MSAAEGDALLSGRCKDKVGQAGCLFPPSHLGGASWFLYSTDWKTSGSCLGLTPLCCVLPSISRSSWCCDSCWLMEIECK